jgi:hypothetical protein
MGQHVRYSCSGGVSRLVTDLGKGVQTYELSVLDCLELQSRDSTDLGETVHTLPEQ